ncbi:hypothetical protein INR49_012883, partial [Caranx melampygus]
MEVTDIGNKEEGKVWHRKPTPGKGVLATVVRTAQQAKTVRFLHVAFDTTGDSFLAGDHHGNIYVFDISRNRFRLVQKTGQACTALAFSLRRTTEFLVALTDYTIKCFDKDTKQLVSWMRGHEGAVSSISVHSSGRYAITTSSDTAQLWDLDSFQRKRKLNIRQSVGIQKVFFLPLSNTILSCFSDDSIFAWESDTLFCKYQLPVPDCGPKISYKAFAVTRDSKRLAAGGRSNLLHLWCLDSKQLLRVIQMPTQVRTVRQLEFLPDSFDGGASQTLGVLSQDGVLRFINIHTCKLLFHIGSHDDAITGVTVSPNGRHIVAIMDNGSINIYSVQSLTQELNKVTTSCKPPSQVAVVSDGDAKQDLSNLKVKVRSEGQKPLMSSGRRQVKILRPPAVSTVDDKENELPAGLNKKRLVALLKAYGEYPAKYRMFVWRSLLCLPENHAAYSSLTDKGLHSAYLTLHDKYPIKSHKLQRGLQRVLSALAHWASIFGELEYLPLVAFPFVKLFQNNPLLCFEVVATVIVNWCQHWFEYFPNPPLNILSAAENVLAHHDKELLQHLVDCGITSQLYVWPLLETLFSEVLTRDEWLRLFDNIFSNHPSFLIMACVAYITCCLFFHHRNNLDVGAMIKEAYRMLNSTPADTHPRTILSDFTPLTTGQYPVFNHYPEFIVEYQSREREKIRQQEMEYLRERLAAMKRELKVKELQLLDATRRRFLKHQQDMRTSQIQRLDQEISRKMDLRERETAAAVQDLEVRQMELEAQRRRLEQHLLKEQERTGQEVEVEMEMRMRKAEREEESYTELLHSTETNMQILEESLAEACQLGLESDWQREVAERLQQVDAEQERKRERLAELHRQTLAEEERLADTMRDMAGRKRQTKTRSPGLIRGRPQGPSSTTAGLVGTNGAGPAVKPHSATTPRSAGTNMVCLNSTSPSESTSTTFSLDRGRAQLDSSERELLKEIRELRQKLASRAREGNSASSQSVHTLSSVSQPMLDLSHNESARLAVDGLLSRGTEGYQEVLDVEADPGADYDDADDGYKDLMSSSVGSRSATQCPAVSTDSDPTVAGCDHSSIKDVMWTDPVLGEPSVELYFHFSWLSWQVHRGLAVLLKGSAVTPFHQEFHRLYSSSTPVRGFVTFMAGPHMPSSHITSRADKNENSGYSKSLTKTDSCWALTEDAQKSQTKAEKMVSTSPQVPDLECNKSGNQPPHRQTGAGTQTHTKPPVQLQKPLAQPGAMQSESEKSKHALIGASAQHNAKTRAEKNQIDLSLGQTHVSYHQPQPAGLTVTSTAVERAKIQESKPLHSVYPTHEQHRSACFQSTMKKDSDLDYDHPGAEGLIPQQRSRNRLTHPSGIAAGLNVQWKYSLNVKPKVELQSDNPILSPSTSQQQAMTGLQFLLTHLHTSGLQHNISSFETRRQHQLQRHHSFPGTEAAGMGPQLQTDSELFPPGMRAKLHLRPPPMLNWMLQSHTARSRLVVKTNSFDATCWARQKTEPETQGAGVAKAQPHIGSVSLSGLYLNPDLILLIKNGGQVPVIVPAVVQGMFPVHALADHTGLVFSGCRCFSLRLLSIFLSPFITILS